MTRGSIFALMFGCVATFVFFAGCGSSGGGDDDTATPDVGLADDDATDDDVGDDDDSNEDDDSTDDDDTGDDDTGDDDLTDDDSDDDDTTDDDAADDDSTDDDTGDDDSTDDDTSDDDITDDDTGDDDTADDDTGDGVERVVIAGDSWSSGFIQATIDEFAERGYSDTVVSWELTSLPGSTAEDWADNDDGRLDTLEAVLDMDPPAELLLLCVSGNDVHEMIDDGYDGWPGFLRDWRKQSIVDDTLHIVDTALAGRPNLHVVLIGYDFLHYEFNDFAYGMGDLSTDEYNLIFAEIGLQELLETLTRPRFHYAHNFGWLQYAVGDVPHPPFLLPLFPYDPATVPAPGTAATGYLPFPGGNFLLPGPLDWIPDGVHPTAGGFRLLFEHTMDQGLENLMNGQPWN
ncbi:MAG: hypothetical protein IT350_13715 [Deltaproteobacteria bacterium]|nr:hypothetical protein [Deltaproteobacteria bacterium]